MPLTADERRAVNKKNAQKSTGPRSDEGKAKARANALKHGLRARELALPNEDPAELQALTDRWYDHYQPESPGEAELIDRAVLSIIQRKRCAKFVTDTITDQMRNASARLDYNLRTEGERLDALLMTDPAEALRSLRLTAYGCRMLLAQWRTLRETLMRDGYWTPEDRDRALALLGLKPEAYRTVSVAYMIRYDSLISHPNVNDSLLRHIMMPGNVPPCYRTHVDTWSTDPAAARGRLDGIITAQVTELETRERYLFLNIEDPDRAALEDRASILEGPLAALVLRYEAMHTGAFHRAYNSLLKGRKDAAHAELRDDPRPLAATNVEAPNEAKSAAVIEAPNEARSAPVAETPSESAPAEAPAESPAPNEANPDASPMVFPAPDASPVPAPVGEEADAVACLAS